MKYEVTSAMEIIHDSVQEDGPSAVTLALPSENYLQLPTSGDAYKSMMRASERDLTRT